MCGIAGFVLLQDAPPVTDHQARDVLAAMAGRIAHRGPDGRGHHVGLPAAFAHCRLAIIDLSTGAQPMAAEDGAAVVTFNGEIYNYQEVRRELQALGRTFQTRSDTEVLLQAYLEWGVACLDRLEGMFAFALWDVRRRTLFAARDRFGKKPFFYTIQQGVFAFASELSALEAVPWAAFSIRASTLARFLAYEYVPTPESIYAEARKLPPAQYLELHEDGTLLVERYWETPMPRPEGSKGFGRADEPALCEELRRLLTQAVRRRLIADVPVGVFLSGGVDSSSVAAMAGQLAPGIKTFSIGFTEASYDESAYAGRVAAQLGTDHQLELLSADACADLLPEVVSRFDEPMADPSIVPTYLLSQITRRQVTVALGGDGPDELLAGYEYYPGFKATQYWERLPAWLRRAAVAASGLLPGSAGYVNPRHVAQTFLAAAEAPAWLRTQRMLTALTPEAQRALWKSPGDMLEPTRLFASTKRLWEALPDWPPMARVFHLFARQYMLDYILVKVDRCTMLHGLEARAPFLDRDLAEFCFRLPVSMKLRGATRKYLLKEAMAGLLPQDILHRPKRGFLIPTAAWLRGRLRPLVDDLLHERRLREQGLFHPAAVRRLVEEHASGKKDHRKGLWTMLVLQLWLAGKPAVRIDPER
ncbi:asparagine synthase (glutamine-hydrolyzing) [Megalodesulfovibrio gigas]|uniref:asparagine synthase (glutamine-hydrolyzing) n=1 Tax=Megalodesulfovibrio gigas (strain ATCC 19364 / DSM 1382 / NCIMB 9332 / VKM B-1759) TaxID=1121448 RepID=T2GBZ5_MEGG1|nr:asparagine synthase (glutamine-hydrolyzing) [Megalodesulfovibrio gigas]AGW13442.1 asparagine synthetase [Megalodesulfovibrio gigas DSM 1382 = ATCC 19364]